MATEARNITIPDDEWKKVGEIAQNIERSRSWVIAKLISGAYDEIVLPTTTDGRTYVSKQKLEEFGLR